MNNNWNKVIYKVWSPIYDRFFNSKAFRHARQKVFEDIELRDGMEVLFVGVGTGADLEFIKAADYQITAIDISSDMLNVARKKYQQVNSLRFIEMDAQNLDFEDRSVDIVIANLILSVVPDADRTFNEIVRVTRQNGTILIFDKFIPKNQELSRLKKLVKPFISLLGTDISIRFENIFSPHEEKLVVKEDHPVLFGNMYRKIVMKKIK